MGGRDALHEQLESLHAISVEMAAVRDMAEMHDRALGHRPKLTDSKSPFSGLHNDHARSMDASAAQGRQPSPDINDRLHEMHARSSVFGVTISERPPNSSNDVADDHPIVGAPTDHPPVKTFQGVPIRAGSNLISKFGVANNPSGYAAEDQRLPQTFPDEVADDDTRLIHNRHAMIDRLEDLNHRLKEAEREKLPAPERERIAEGLPDEIGEDRPEGRQCRLCRNTRSVYEPGLARPRRLCPGQPPPRGRLDPCHSARLRGRHA